MNLYQIFDVNKPIMNANVELFAKTPIEAVKEYMAKNNIEGSPKRSASNYVRFSARQIVIKENGQKMFSYKPTQWYEVKFNN